MGLRHLQVAVKALVVLSCGLALKAYAVCPPGDRYEEDNRSGYCYDKWTGEYFNRYESIRPGDAGHPESRYRLSETRVLQYWDATTGDWEPVPVRWVWDLCTLDLWLLEIDWCKGTWDFNPPLIPGHFTNDPEEEDDD